MHSFSRRKFLKVSGSVAGGALLSQIPFSAAAAFSKEVKVCAHLWVYASAYPPTWDSTPELDRVFSELKYAGYDGVELMEVNLRHEDAVPRLKKLVDQYKLPVSGTSYGADMWNKEKQREILEDVELVTTRLQQVGGKTFGISVGDAGHKKTEAELNTQAEVLRGIIQICKKKAIVPNLHNHTYEVAHGLHDLKGTLARVPHLKLGPDLNWLIRGGVDPIAFIKEYGKQMVYMHIRDQKEDGKWTEAVGEGVTDFKAIAQALKEVSFNDWVAVELAFDAPAVRPIKENWKMSREYVKKVFGW
jgi:sugar phosphate isomerase/epimerase